ncbi:hypothetical protein LCGC14_1204880 [marine sediment metagenome]|uniref:Uncharacterized protein n=1 Tax=marine sediment metagenome TaxID=412755 RepID=A0A0F9NY75_9ZZZZ
MTDEAPTFVIQEKCSSHRWRMIGTFLSVVGMGAILVFWAVVKGYTAEKQAGQVDNRLNVHEAAQETHEDHLRETLDRIYAAQERTLDKLDDIDKGVNGK